MLLDLPDALHENILRFLSVHSADRFSVARVCRQLLRDVEAFSKKELARITKEYAVDDDWMFRVGMQARALQEKKQDGSFLPSTVSQRRMLWSAYQTHIFSLGTDPSEKWTTVLSLAMHSNGKRLLSGGHGRRGDPTNLRLWDVPSQQCVRSFVGHSSCVSDLAVSAGHVVSYSSAELSIRMWNLATGACSILVEHHDYSSEVHFAASDEEIFLTPALAWDDEHTEAHITAINVVTGANRTSPPYEWCRPDYANVRLSLCGDSLLVMRICDPNDESAQQNAPMAGIYVLDPSSLELVSSMKEVYVCIKASSNGDIVAETEDGRFDVYRLEDNQIVYRRSLHVTQVKDLQDDGEGSILLVHDSRAYVERAPDKKAAFSCTDVYNIETGRFERTLCHPKRYPHSRLSCMVACSEGNVILCGFTQGFGYASGYNEYSSIKAYILE